MNDESSQLVSYLSTVFLFSSRPFKRRVFRGTVAHTQKYLSQEDRRRFTLSLRCVFLQWLFVSLGRQNLFYM